MLRVVLIFIGILLLLYGLYAGYFYYIQRHLIFPRHLLPPVQTTIVDFPGWQQRWIEVSGPMGGTAGTARVESWYLPPMPHADATTAPVFVVAHGNGEVIDDWPPNVAGLQRQGYGVLLVEYPGYGRSTGEPTEEIIAATLVDAYDWLISQSTVDADRIFLFGFSVGGGAIGTLAAQRPSAALVLMSTFSSVRALAGRFYLPTFLVRDPFDNLAMIRHYSHPTLLIHGLHDITIPYIGTVLLHESSPNSKLLLLPCGHADCVDDWDEFWRLILDFLAEQQLVN